MTLDPRITPARPDLAAKHLEGKVEAARFAEGEDYEVIDAQVPVRRAPSPDAPLDTEALLGERVTVYEFNQEGWLCPALFKYFKSAPREIYVKVEPRSQG